MKKKRKGTVMMNTFRLEKGGLVGRQELMSEIAQVDNLMLIVPEGDTESIAARLLTLLKEAQSEWEQSA